jgi:hypothetical protein
VRRVPGRPSLIQVSACPAPDLMRPGSPVDTSAVDPAPDLRLLLASRYPLLVAECHDEPRLLAVLRQAAAGPAGGPSPPDRSAPTQRG